MNRANLMCGYLIVMALWLAGSGSASAQQTDAAQPSLVIAATIIGQRYCANSPDMMTLQMRLHVRYTNAGNQKLILYRGDDLFYQAKIRAVRAAAGAKPYEIAVLNARYLEIENELLEQPAPGKLFVILQPGSSYETETMVGVGVIGGSTARARHAIMEGEHTLQLIISTWYRSQGLAEKLRRQWQRKGFLWSGTVASNEISFKAERPQSPPSCK
jgi:hypothetical protein